MKKNGLFAAAAAVCLGFVTPQVCMAAGEWPLDQGDYVEVSMIKVDDGHSLDYAKHLAGMWRDSQDYAKAQGWITNYQIWSNDYPRDGEPDIYLVTWVPKMVDGAEAQRRADAYNAHMKTTEAQLEAASGKRAEYRHMAGTMLMRQLTWAK